MAGLMQPQAPQGAPMQQAPTQPTAMPQEGGEGVSPEEQAQYEAWVKNAMELMYNEKSMEQVVAALQGDGSPVEGLANALVMVTVRLEDSAAEQGQAVSEDVKFHAANEILSLLSDLAEAAGVHTYTEQEAEQAFMMAMDLYRDLRQDSINPEEYQQDFNDLMAADQGGQLESMVPGIGEFANRQQGAPQGPGAQPGTPGQPQQMR